MSNLRGGCFYCRDLSWTYRFWWRNVIFCSAQMLGSRIWCCATRCRCSFTSCTKHHRSGWCHGCGSVIDVITTHLFTMETAAIVHRRGAVIVKPTSPWKELPVKSHTIRDLLTVEGALVERNFLFHQRSFGSVLAIMGDKSNLCTIWKNVKS